MDFLTQQKGFGRQKVSLKLVVGHFFGDTRVVESEFGEEKLVLGV